MLNFSSEVRRFTKQCVLIEARHARKLDGSTRKSIAPQWMVNFIWYIRSCLTGLNLTFNSLYACTIILLICFTYLMTHIQYPMVFTAQKPLKSYWYRHTWKTHLTTCSIKLSSIIFEYRSTLAIPSAGIITSLLNICPLRIQPKGSYATIGDEIHSWEKRENFFHCPGRDETQSPGSLT